MKNLLLSVALNAVNTGDKFPWGLVLFIAVLLGSIACIVLLTLTRKK